VGLNLGPHAIDKGCMPNSQTEPQSAGFWETVTSALAALARQGGGSLTHNPLPELRFTAREWDHAADRSERK
jgi:hypothetical protein